MKKLSRVWVLITGFLIISWLYILASCFKISASPEWPVSITVSSSGEIKPGGYIKYTIRISARRSVDVIIKITYYLPGKGWSGWKRLWSGYLSSGSSHSEIYTVDIPSNVKTGGIVLWVDTYFYSSRDYLVLDNDYYYGSYSSI